MKEIRLTNGSTALVDDDDYERVATAGNWYEDISGHGKRTYAYRRFNIGGVFKKVYLHKFIIGDSGGLDIDHDDGNGLNCQKANLLSKSRSANNLNNHNPRTDNKSGVRGVYFDAYYGGYRAEIKMDGIKYNLGLFTTLEAAAEIRREAEDKVKRGISPKEIKTRGLYKSKAIVEFNLSNASYMHILSKLNGA